MEDFSFSEIRKRMGMFMDNELNPEDQKKFLTEIKQNPDLQNAVNRDRAVREKLKEKVTRPSLAPGLVDKIKTKVGL